MPVTFENIVNTQSFIQGTAYGSPGILGFFTFALRCFLWFFIAVLANQFLFI